MRLASLRMFTSFPITAPIAVIRAIGQTADQRDFKVMATFAQASLIVLAVFPHIEVVCNAAALSDAIFAASIARFSANDAALRAFSAFAS